MRKSSLLLLVAFKSLLDIASASASLFDGPDAKLTFHLTSEVGTNVVGMPFEVGSLNPAPSGSKYSTVHGVSDSNGMVTLQIANVFGTVSYDENSVAGYYASGGKYQFSNVAKGRWQPWNPTVGVIVKQIINPIPMYARKVGVSGSNLILPAKDTPIGFDLEIADWVAPYGKGTTADFIFTLSDKGSTNNNQKDGDFALTLSFSNKRDGIQSFIEPLNNGSALRLPRFAPQGVYAPNLVMDKGYQYAVGMLREDQNYFFRVRTVIDDGGKIQSALYGKIAGPIQFLDNAGIEFTYYLNPTPNDRNMEFDPKKNLFQNLTSDQKVDVP